MLLQQGCILGDLDISTDYDTEQIWTNYIILHFVNNSTVDTYTQNTSAARNARQK
jgi:hypothetical protein